MSDFLLSLKDVSLAFGGPQVLDKVSLSIQKGLRAALTGRNGEGKSTLMKVIAGTLEPDTGEIVRAPGLKVVYVSQDVRENSADGRMVGCSDVPMTNHSNAQADCDLELSGGQIRRARLERALLSQPDLLLLDEPTNHLDVENIDWLEGMIRRQREMAVVIVTHDRRFLKRVATNILDLDRGELAGWECDYPTFVKRKRELLADEAVYWERKSKKLAQEEAWIRRGVKARTTRNEGRVAALLKLREEFAARRRQVGTATMKLDTAAAGGVRVLKIEKLGFGYSSEPIISNFTADVLRGERIGILGRNGAGKTTLLKLLTGKLKPSEGSVTLGTGVEMAFLDQLRGELNPELTVGENIASDRDEVIVGGVKKHVYSYLADFLFAPERVRTPVKALSGGERARLMLAKLFLKPANLLVMDEPTNDLDIETLELLEEQLLNYSGTLLLVSHDREFLDNVVTSTFVLEGD
ncbi:MAG: ATP-binding cassette domain-containing protein, partial [bacterium]|nr:ATP-binding cassette domain-containing protein [Candidatus Colisoma equi]